MYFYVWSVSSLKHPPILSHHHSPADESWYVWLRVHPLVSTCCPFRPMRADDDLILRQLWYDRKPALPVMIRLWEQKQAGSVCEHWTCVEILSIRGGGLLNLNLLEARGVGRKTHKWGAKKGKAGWFQWGSEMWGWRRQVAGLLYTKQTHKQLFISQSPVVPPPHKPQFTLTPFYPIPLLLHPHPRSKPYRFCHSAPASLLWSCANIRTRDTAGSPVHLSPSALRLRHLQH